MRTITAERFRGTSSQDEVVEVVREFIGEWMPEELGILPLSCRPGKLKDGEDLNMLALELARACMAFETDPARLAVLEEMEVFIGHACHRAAELERYPSTSAYY